MGKSKPVLSQSDLESIERIVAKANDDAVNSIAQQFEQLEERIDIVELRFYRHISELAERVEVEMTG